MSKHPVIKKRGRGEVDASAARLMLHLLSLSGNATESPYYRAASKTYDHYLRETDQRVLAEEYLRTIND